MSISLRAVLASLAISSLYGSFVYACPKVSRDLGLDFWNFADYEEQIRQCEEKQNALQATGERVLRRLSLKFTITSDLIEERITLKEATFQFITLNRMDPELMTTTRSLHPGASDEECVARQVISFVRNNTYHGNLPSTALLEHLDGELHQLVRQPDALR